MDLQSENAVNAGNSGLLPDHAVILNDTASASDADDCSKEMSRLQKLLEGRYVIEKRIGKGAQGTVYLAAPVNSTQKVAIKQLQIQSVKDWKLYDLFHREAETLKRLDIPGVVRLREAMDFTDISSPVALIVQDYIEGKPLQEFIAQGHRFQVNQIGDILLQLLDILEKLHHCDPPVIHRDIKPSNIVLNYDELNGAPIAHLIDFGAVSNPQVKGGGSTVVGTYGYMAPEQLMGRAVPESDLYSLAIVAVYLLSGVPPEDLEIQDFHILIDPHLTHLPYQITAILRKMLEPRAEDRLTDYSTLRTVFQAIKEQRFNDIPCVQRDRMQDRYSIENVHSYHQKGNIALWEALSERTPRQLGRVKISRASFLEANKGNFKGLGISLIVLVVSGCFVFSASLFNLISCVVWVSFLVVCLMCVFNIFEKVREKFRKIKFLKYARKTLATVVRIEYKAVTPWMSESARNRLSENTMRTYRPLWTISYSFNPNHDGISEPIVNTFSTHIEPDFKEGELIPILYYNEINKKVYKETGIYSAPYPFPLEDEFQIVRTII